MKKFIHETIKYFIIILFICILMVGITYIINSSAKFNISEDKTMFFVGDSHTECSVNDKIFTQAFNVSQSGASYMYSYIKVKKFLEVNNNIEKVIVSFHGDSIQRSRDEWTVGEKYILAHVPNYVSLLSINEFKVLIKNKALFSALLKTPIKSVESIFKYVLNHSIAYSDLNIGGYFWLDRDKLQTAVEIQNTNSENPMEYSVYQLEFLLKIAALCKQYKVELILFNSPSFKPETYGNLDELYNYYNKYLKGIKYIDYSNFDLPEYGYGDIGHLNYKGAEIFSKYLEEHYQEIF